MRSIVIIGLGNFGFHCALQLEGRADVTAIDKNREIVQKIGSHVSRAVVADAKNREVLREIGIESCDVAVVGVGQSEMEASILITLHLKALGVKEIYAKSQSDEHSEILRLVGATRVIQPEREVAENVAMSILAPAVTDYLRLHEDFAIIEVDAPEVCAGKTLQELGLRRKFNVTVIGIFRRGDRLVNPAPDTTILKGDRLAILGEEKYILEFEHKFYAELD